MGYELPPEVRRDYEQVSSPDALARGDFNARKRLKGPDRLMTGEPCPVIVTRLVLDKATREIVAMGAPGEN